MKKVLSLFLAIILCATMSIPALAGSSVKFPELATAGQHFTIAVNNSRGYAIQNNGSLWEWDNGGTVNPVQIMTDVVSIRAKSNNTYALKSDGTVWAWESGNKKADGGSTSPQQILTGIVTIAAEYEGYGVFLAIKTDGTLVNWDNQSETAVMTDVASVFISHQAMFFGDYLSEIVSEDAVFAMKTDGTLWKWDYEMVTQVTENVAETIAAFKNPQLDTDGTYYRVEDNWNEEKEYFETKFYKAAENVSAFTSDGYRYNLLLKEDGTLWVDLDTQIMSGVRLPAVAAVTAKPTSAAVYINGQSVAFDAYNIQNNNYFKLRDLAIQLSGTGKQFEVTWDGARNAINLLSGQSYTSVGGEMTGKGTGDVAAQTTTAKIYIDGKEVSLTAYNIGNNNYFKLRDIAQAFDFGVTWDGAKQSIVIDTNTGYTPE